jgi:hypothetical protein
LSWMCCRSLLSVKPNAALLRGAAAYTATLLAEDWYEVWINSEEFFPPSVGRSHDSRKLVPFERLESKDLANIYGEQRSESREDKCRRGDGSRSLGNEAKVRKI